MVREDSATIKFSRLLNTGDSEEDQTLELGKTYNISWAYRSNALIMEKLHDA
jgi:hypothetical protein